MRFCSCGKLLGNLLFCLPDMMLYDYKSMIEKSDGKIKEIIRTAWQRRRLPFNLNSTYVISCAGYVTSASVNVNKVAAFEAS